MPHTFLLILLITLSSFGQEKYIAHLPSDLNESSGLVIYEKFFISMNDSGNDAELIVFNKKGELIQRVRIENATNSDWEALTLDSKGNLYIADIGDNANKRKGVVIYIVPVKEVVAPMSTRVKAKRIEVTYAEKKKSPPSDDQLYYDAEAIVHRNDSLFIFTKNRTKPFDGESHVYGFPDQPGSYSVTRYATIQLPPTNWMENSVTDATRCNMNIYVLTYRYIYTYTWKGKTFHEVDRVEMNFATQKEALFYYKGSLYLTDEKSPLGKPRLYRLKLEP